MASRRYPFDMFDEMERMMERMRRSMYEGVDDVRSMTGMGDAHVTLEESDDGYVAIVDVPGFETDEIDLSFADGHLVLAATHEVSGDSPVGSVSRSREVHERISVPGDVVVEEIEASYRNGVLEVLLPTEEAPESEESHHIDVE